MTDHWKDVDLGRLTKYMPRDAHRLLLARIAAARAKDAEDRQQEQQAHAAELAALHDIIAAYEAVTDPEQHPDLFARSSAVLEDCRNPACADQAVVQDLRDQLAAKDAEIVSLRAQIDEDAHLRSVVELYRSDPIAMADALVRMREALGAAREQLEQRPA